MSQAELVALSQRLLIACDQSYAGEQLVVGESVLSRLDDAPLYGEFQPPFESLFPQYSVAFRREDATTGFKVVVYRNDETREIIVAMAGSDGNDLKDWWSNLTHYGWNQWSRNRVAVLQAVDQLVTELGGSGTEAPKIHFTGQSLGGALAQYATYEFVETHQDYARQNLSLVTFNGLGGVAALREELPRRIAGDPIPGYPQLSNTPYNSSLVAGIGNIAHYGSLNDLVWRAGSGHLGGNVYSFAGLDFGSVNPQTNEPYLLDTISAHKIETGYYYPLTEFDRAAVSAFEAAINAGVLSRAQLDASYLKVESLQRLSSILGNLFRQSETSSSGAMLKLLFGGLGTLAFGDSGEVNQLVRAYVESRNLAGKYAGKEEEYLAAKDTDWSFRMRIGAAALGLSAASGPFGLIMKAAAGIALAPVYKLVDGVKNDDGEFVLRQTFELQRQGSAVPDRLLEETQEASTLIGAALGVTPPVGSDLPLGTIALLTRDDVEGFAEAMVSAGEDWYLQTSTYLVGRANTLGMQDKAQLALNEFWTYSRYAAGNNVGLVASVAEQFTSFTSDWSGASADVSTDRVAPSDSTIQVVGLSQFAEKRKFWSSVLGGLEGLLDLFVGTAHASSTREAVREAIGDVRASAQSVLIRLGHGDNPFDEASFDPEAAPLPAGALEEGSFSAFTAYLPYEAGEGGQRINLEFAGAAAEKLLVYADGEEVELDVDGTFSLTVSEGQREISFEVFALEDVDADETLMLSAQLANGVGEATHLEHEELALSVDAQDEVPPSAGLEYRGDWNVKYYRRMNADGTPAVDDNGQPIYETRLDTRYPHFDNVERTQDAPPADLPAFYVISGAFHGAPLGPTMSSFRGHDGTDSVQMGRYNGADVARTLGGDDAIAGSGLAPNIIYAGSGSDWVEGRGFATHGGEQSQFVHQGRLVTLGDDQIYGGAGDDALYGESAETQDLLNDPSHVATGLPGDWINGGTGNDRLYGTAGDDVLLGGTGEDLMQGGAGRDVLLGDENFGLSVSGNYWRVMHTNFGDSTFSGFEVGLFPIYNYSSLLGGTPDDVDPNVQDPYVTYYKQGGDDVLIGGAGEDLLIGQAGDDTLYGGDDDDILAGWEGGDQIAGGDGNDMIAGDFGRYEQPSQRLLPAANVGIAGLVGSSAFDASQVDQVGNDYLDGGAGNDTIFGEGGDDALMGREGTDTLFGDANYLPDELHGADLLDGGAGNDFLYGNAGNDRLFGGADNDLIDAGAGDDHAEGGAGSDSIFGGEGDDTLKGGEGEDVLAGDAGVDILYGGTGNDGLASGEGDDTLYGEAGADSLEGGAGADYLHGGSGDDLLSGGDSDDRLEGGAGIDVLRGGEGDDTYVVSLGYGQDIIEDTQGRNRLSLGAGIAAEGMSASVDSSTLAATITFSGIGDAVTFNAGEVDVAGVDFASGASWGRKEFLGFLPAILKEGSEEGETLSGHESLRNELRGEGGDDTVVGSANDDILAGSDGADALDGRSGSDRYAYAADESGVDVLNDSGISARAYLEWFYAARGVADWEERGLHGGRYRAEGGGEGGSFREYFDTYEDAVDQYPFATITQVEPLLDVAPLVARDDDAALEQLAAAGVLDRDVVEFGAGLTLEDLTLTLRVNAAEAAGHPGEPARAGGTLSVRWNAGDSGVELAVPDSAYGFPGQDLFADGEENSEDPDAWRGYRLGEGIEEFRLADGTAYSLQEMLSRATIVEVVEPLRVGRDEGDLTIGPNYEAVVFEDAIRSFEIGISREGVNLLLAGPGTLVRIAGWFADPERMPATRLEFETDSPLGPHALTEAALVLSGDDADEALQGLDRFRDTLYGFGGNDTLHGFGGDDVLDGGDGDDLMVGGEGDDSLTGGLGADHLMLERGGGRDRHEWSFESEAPASEDRIRAAADVSPGQVVTTRGSSSLWVRIEGTDDGIEIPNWFDDVSARLGGVEFADGTFWDANEMEARLEPAPGSEGDDEIFGTTGGDSIDALAGSDFVYTQDGDDVVAGGAGDDQIDPGEGYDIARGGDGDDSLDGGGQANDLLEGGAGEDYIYLEGHTLAIGGAGDDWIDNFGPGAVVAFNPGDGRDTIYAYDSLTLSLGGGIQASMLSLSEDGEGLLLSIGASDSIRLTREFEPESQAWPEITLQLFGSAHAFDFSGVIADFYAALAADPSLAAFPLAGVLEEHRTGFSETAALGGALAWHYATTGSTAGLTDDEIRSVLRDPAFGVAAQPMSLGNGNQAPTLANALADQEIAEDSAFAYVVATDTFVDPDAGDVLTYAATLEDGSALPGWLAFDAATASFTGTPANDDVGTFEVRVAASDQAGLSAIDTFSITVRNVNDAPTLADPIADQSGSAGDPFTFSFAGDAFADVDQGDMLSYSAALADGSALPGWLAFDGTTRTFNGTPPAAMSLQVRVTAADESGASAADEFALEVTGTAGEMIIGTPAHDTLVGTPGDDLLAGRRGNDTLVGRLGDDVYLHEQRGGHDVIKEIGGNDTLLFGAGITAPMVRLERHRHDLVVDLAGPHGSVTIKDWFASASKRIERIQFADGTTWDEGTIRARSDRGHGHCQIPRHEDRDHHLPGSHRDDERKHERRDENRRDQVAERVGERVGRAPRFDFDRLIESLAGHPRSLPSKEIAQRWAAVRRYAETLEGQDSDDDGRALSLAGLLRPGSVGWGFEGSTGASHVQEEFETLEGLREGFRRL